MNIKKLKLTSLITILSISCVPLTSCNYDYDLTFKYTYSCFNDGYILDELDLKDEGYYENIEMPTKFRGKDIYEIKALGKNFKNSEIKILKYFSYSNEVRDEFFLGFDKLENVVLDKNIKWIGDSAFNGCSNLESINITNSLYYIGRSAFMNTSKLSIVFDDYNVYKRLRVCDMAFKNSGIKLFGEEGKPIRYLEYLGDRVFENCVLDCLYINELSGTWDETFNGATINDFEIKKCGFYKWGSFNNCKINENKFKPNFNSQNFGTMSLKGLRGITNFIVPSGVKEIKNDDFKDCSDLITIQFGTDVENIENNLFANCSSLEKIIILGDPSLDSGFILPNENCTLYIKKDTTIYNYCVENELKFILI